MLEWSTRVRRLDSRRCKFATCSTGPNSALSQLPCDRWVLDLRIIHEQEGFAENQTQDAVALKRQAEICCRIPRTLHDAQVAAARLHQDVGASDVDAVLMAVTSNNQKPPIHPAPVSNRQLRQQIFKGRPPVLCRQGQIAECKMLPVRKFGSCG